MAPSTRLCAAINRDPNCHPNPGPNRDPDPDPKPDPKPDPDEVVRGCALPRLCELIEMGQARDARAVADVLRALCRGAPGAAACREVRIRV